MLRSVRYGLYGIVLAGLVLAGVAWINVDKTVHLVVDGHSHSVRTTADDVGQVVVEAGYRIGKHDILAPGADAGIHDGSTIVYKRGRLLQLNVDGARKNVWTTAPTVAIALNQLGYSYTDFVSVSRSTRLPLRPSAITVRTPKVITVVHDGNTDYVRTTDLTVGQLMADLGITADGNDRVSLSADSALSTGTKIVIQRVRHATVAKLRKLPFRTETKHDAALLVGTTKIVKKGSDGLSKTTYAVVYVDGKRVDTTKLKTVVLRKAKPLVKKVGTKPKPAPPPSEPAGTGGSTSASGSGSGSSSGGSSSSSSSGHIASPSEAKAYARKQLAARGWSDQYSCLASLWGKESAWRVTAANPSGAYGIPQALPGSKMGPGWRTSATVQINWGLSYIADRYNTPCGAWSYWQGHNYY